MDLFVGTNNKYRYHSFSVKDSMAKQIETYFISLIYINGVHLQSRKILPDILEDKTPEM
jgi:hypothetical protein